MDRPAAPKRVLSLFWNFSLGGVAQYAVLLERVAQHQDVALRTFCVLKKGRQVDQKSLEQLQDRVVVWRTAIWDFRWLWRLRQEIRDWVPDAVMSHGFNAHLLALLARLFRRTLRVACTYHGQYHAPTAAKRLVAPLYDGFTEWFLRRHAHGVVAVAEYSKRYLIEHGIEASLIEVIHNGIADVPPDLVARNCLRRDWQVTEKEILVGVASRLDPVKGLAHLLEAFEHLASRQPRLKLLLIGTGTMERELKARVFADGLTDRVVFAGFRSDVPLCLEAMDIFVLPSLAEYHSIGLLEAMRASRPIIATNVGGNTESVRHESEALIVPPADSGALASAVERLIGDKDLRNRLGRAARQRFLEKFTAERTVERTADWLRRTIAVQSRASFR